MFVNVPLLTSNKNLTALKQNVIISILADTGIRRTELVKIKISNISFKDNSIFLEHTKNRKKRFRWVSNETALLIKELVEQCSTEYLIENMYNNDHMEPNAISQIFKKIKKDLNVERLSPHMLRHTFATNLDKQNVDIETMRVLLGHSDYSQLKNICIKKMINLGSHH